MGLRKQYIDGDTWVIEFEGRIDTSNASDVQAALEEPDAVTKVIIDANDLEYLSSAGLRVLLHIKKKYKNTEVINVSSEVYEILDMTGFTEMLKVEKQYKSVSVEGCDEIGRGANGIVYRTDPETIVKVYRNKDALPEIKNERDIARKALILGIPTAISYDIVRVGDHFGSVFELLNATSISKTIAKDPSSMDDCVDRFASLLKTIHSIAPEKDTFPSERDIVNGWGEFLEEYLPKETYKKLMHLLTSIPEDNHLVHGDYHSNNVMIQNGETMLIDMDTLCQGNAIYEFGSMFLAFYGFYIFDKENCLDFLHIDADTAYTLFRKTMAKYLETEDETVVDDLQERASVIGYTRLMRRTIRRIGFEDPKGKQIIEHCEKELTRLCEKYDSII